VVSTQDIKLLRERTGAGVLDCKEALAESGGDVDRALEALRARGAEIAEKRAERPAEHGYVATYGHAGRIGVLVELRCETDFVSSNKAFRELAREVALQVAAQRPRWVSRADVPATVVEEIVTEETARAVGAGKVQTLVDRIVTGKVERFYRDNCLLEQPYIRNDKETIADLISEKTIAFGERIFVHGFVRRELGE
jgi:elongation factor Ts